MAAGRVWFTAFTGVDRAVYHIERGTVAEVPEANVEVSVSQDRVEIN